MHKTGWSPIKSKLFFKYAKAQTTTAMKLDAEKEGGGCCFRELRTGNWSQGCDDPSTQDVIPMQ
jgi:hypothetical protein